jgi:hypothetical protein
MDMKKEIQKIAKKEMESLREKKISRKEAIKKAGYMAISAATTMILLGTPKTASASPAPPPSNAPTQGTRKNNGPWKKK